MKKRDINVELLRCMMMFLIVAHHCYMYGIWSKSGRLLDLLFYDLINFHVDVFIVISGWYGIKFAWRKFWKLFGIIVFYRVLSVIFNCYITGGAQGLTLKSISSSGGWFGPTYLMMMLMMPLLNAGIDALFSSSKKALFSAWCVFAFGMLICWSPFRPIFGLMPSGYGDRTLLTLLFVYFTSRSARLLRLEDIPLVQLWPIPFFFFLIIALKPLFNGYYYSAIGFNAPQVVAISIFLMLIALRIHVGDGGWMGGFVSLISPYMFDVFLFHEATSFGRRFFVMIQHWMSSFGIGSIAGVLLSAVVCMTAGIMIGVFRHYCCAIIKLHFRRS